MVSAHNEGGVRVESADLRGMRFSPGGDSLYFLGFFRPPGIFAVRLGGTSMALQLFGRSYFIIII